MERYNIFHMIHKGLRASLYHTGLYLQQADFTDMNTEAEVTGRVKEILLLFDGHAKKEDTFILPAIQPYEPSVVASFEAEHEEDHRLGLWLQECLLNLENAGNLLEKLLSGRALNEAFTAFIAFNLQHMAKEEDIINKVLWRYYHDEELMMLSKKVAASVEPWIADFYGTWMLRAVNDQEAGDWISAAGQSLPEVAFQTLLRKAETEWGMSRFGKITETMPAERNVA